MYYLKLMLYAREHNQHVYDKYQTSHTDNRKDDQEAKDIDA